MNVDEWQVYFQISFQKIYFRLQLFTYATIIINPAQLMKITSQGCRNYLYKKAYKQFLQEKIKKKKNSISYKDINVFLK